MARAVFNLTADSSSVVAALGALPGATRRAATLMAGEFRKGWRSMERDAERSTEAMRRSVARLATEERRLTQAAEAQAQRRTTIARTEARTVSGARKRQTDEAIREEQRLSSAVESGARRRVSAARREVMATSSRESSGRMGTIASGGGWRGGAARFAGGAMQFAASAHGMMTDARRADAGAEQALMRAVSQAGPGADRREAMARFARVRETSVRTGRSTAEIADAVLGAQAEFSSLEGPDAATRGQRFESVISAITRAASVGEDPAQMARVHGLLQSVGFGESRQDQLTRFVIGAGRRGAIDPGSLTREAMSSIRLRMSDAATSLGPSATREQREAEMDRVFRQQVAALQVFKGEGATPRQAGNALAATQQALRGSVRQDKLLQNIRSFRDTLRDPRERAGYDTLLSTAFERDPTRTGDHMRLRADYQDPLAFQALLHRATGGNAQLASNILAGGGHGNPQSLLANQRQLFTMLGGSDAGGVTAAERVRRLMGATVTDADFRTGEDMFFNNSQAELNRNETVRNRALTEPGVANDASRATERWASEHPFLASAAGLFGASALRGVAGFFMGGSGAAAGVGGAVAGAGALGTAALGGGALLAGGGFALSVDKLAKSGGNTVGGLVDRARADPARLAAVDAANMASINSTAQRTQNGGFGDAFARMMADAVREGAREGTRAGIGNPSDNQHANQVARQAQPSNPSR